MASPATINNLSKKPPVAATASIAGEDSLVLNLVIDDPEVVSDLKKRDEGRPRNSFAVSALRIGILALRQAQGSVDADALKHEGQHLISSLSHELQLRVADIDRSIASVLKQYFDPKSGHFTERVERLVKKDGDLECANRVIGPHGKDSALRRWGLSLGARGGSHARRRAVVAVARKLAVLLHRIWITQEVYVPFYEVAA